MDICKTQPVKMLLLLSALFFSNCFAAQKQSFSNAEPARDSATKKNVQNQKEWSIPELIPHKTGDKYGFIDRERKVIISHAYNNVGFYTEDCTLLNSPKMSVRKYGSADYASVSYHGNNYRIDRAGKRVYRFKKEELGRCNLPYVPQQFEAYRFGNSYGIIEPAKFENSSDYRQFTIYPQYDYLHILEGNDVTNPLIVAARNNRFGIIDVQNNIVLPFVYSDIKRNYSWKLAHLFEATYDGKNYFFVDRDGNEY